MARPYATILFLNRESIARADLPSRGADSLILWQEPRPPVDDLSVLIESALRLGGPPSKQVWILDSELWTQILPLPLSAIRQSSPNEIAQALKFEAEALSGISAFDAEIGYQELNTVAGDKNFWCSVTSSSQFKQCAELLEAENSRLMGYLHPAGLSQSLQASVKDPQRWRRLEIWSDLICGIVGGGGVAPVKKLINADPEGGFWLGEWEEWTSELGAVDAQETLSLGSFNHVLEGEMAPFDISNHDVLNHWLFSWSQILVSQPEAVARIIPPRKPVETPVLVGLSFVLALLTLGLCFFHHSSQLKQLEEFKKQTDKAELPAKSMAELDVRIKGMKNEEKKASKEIAELAKRVAAGTEILSVQRSRFAHLLAEVAQNLPEGAILESLETKNGDVYLRGLCSNPEKSHTLATRLAKSLAKDSWRVNGPKTVAQESSGNTGYWAFELTLKDVPSPHQSKLSKSPTKKRKSGRGRP
ncbi:MAG: hypothetical protein P1V97_32710 [Planctomycetota bacterium]|nr:hypothetical protein [Planctomycetota bacterium]